MRNALLPRIYSSGQRIVLTLLLIALAGCGEPRAKSVDVDLARETLEQVLLHWKTGGTIDELRQGKPEVVVQERMWSEGGTLQDYKLVDEGRAEDANWFCEVELTVVPADGGKAKTKTVTYVVGTDPVITVFHAIL